MKTIVIAGAHSNVGKSGLAGEICALIPGAVHVKLGHGRRKEGIANFFYPAGTPFDRIATDHPDASVLVIESNGILREIEPECTIYLTGGDPKPSAALAAEKADITRGERLDMEALRMISSRLHIPAGTVSKIACLAGAEPCGHISTRSRKEE